MMHRSVHGPQHSDTPAPAAAALRLHVWLHPSEQAAMEAAADLGASGPMPPLDRPGRPLPWHRLLDLPAAAVAAAVARGRALAPAAGPLTRAPQALVLVEPYAGHLAAAAELADCSPTEAAEALARAVLDDFRRAPTLIGMLRRSTSWHRGHAGAPLEPDDDPAAWQMGRDDHAADEATEPDDEPDEEERPAPPEPDEEPPALAVRPGTLRVALPAAALAALEVFDACDALAPAPVDAPPRGVIARVLEAPAPLLAVAALTGRCLPAPDGPDEVCTVELDEAAAAALRHLVNETGAPSPAVALRDVAAGVLAEWQRGLLLWWRTGPAIAREVAHARGRAGLPLREGTDDPAAWGNGRELRAEAETALEAAAP